MTNSYVKALFITRYNFAGILGGAEKRTLYLAKILSNHVKVKILHRGPDMKLDNFLFVGYKLPHVFNVHHVSDLVSPYITTFSADFYSKVWNELDYADIIQVEQPFLLPLVYTLVKMRNKDLPIILDAHNVEFFAISSKFNGISINSFLTSLTLPEVFLLEKMAVKQATIITCVSERDKEMFNRFYRIPLDKTEVITNGVDVEKFEKASVIPSLIGQKVIFFHGLYSWYPNLEAAKLIIEYIAPKVREALFLLAGAGIPPFLIAKANKLGNVKILGYVDKLENLIKSASICIAPILRGGGTRLKMLEYAAATKPIVATFKAVEGLGMINGVHGLFYKSVNEDFINGVKEVLENEELARELGKNAQALAKRYDWCIIGEKLYEVYRKLLEKY